MAHAPNRPTPAALRALARRDPALGAVMKDMRRSAPFPGFPETATKARESHYESLARAIVFQQLSGKAASTIWGRAVALTPGRAFPKPADLLALGEEPVRGCGISRPKLAALTDLATRAVEGRLGLRNAARLDKLVVQVESRMPEVVYEHHQNLCKRVEELMGGTRRVDEADLARELALLADRLDVSEEVSRLRSHLVQLRELLAAAGPEAMGRKLDFLIQETLREVNTIGSKCNDATVSHWVVDMKNVVERLREQVQNVE